MSALPSLERIRQLRGVEEFKALAERLDRVARNKRGLPAYQVRLPNYLFIEAPGCGVTTHLHMLTDLLYDLKLIPFEGDRRFFEWELGPSAFAPDGAFDGLKQELTAMAGFHSTFRGVVGLDVDAWVEASGDGAFRQLLYMAEDHMGQILFVYTMQLREGRDPSDLIRRLSSMMPLEVIRCPLPSPEDMALYLADFLRRRNFRVALSTVDALRGIMPRLIAAQAFDGFQTLDNLADEIVYRYFAAAERSGDMLISPEDVAFIGQPGGYVDRLARRSPRGAVIGFQDGGDRT